MAQVSKKWKITRAAPSDRQVRMKPVEVMDQPWVMGACPLPGQDPSSSTRTPEGADKMNSMEEIESRLLKLEAESAAATTVLAALIRVASDPKALHLSMTMAFEMAAGAKLGPLRDLTDEQVRYARDIVEGFGTIATRFPKPFAQGDD